MYSNFKRYSFDMLKEKGWTGRTLLAVIDEPIHFFPEHTQNIEHNGNKTRATKHNSK